MKFSAPKLTKGLGDKPYFYFVHSYHAVPVNEDLVTAVTDYGEEVTVIGISGEDTLIVRRKNRI